MLCRATMRAMRTSGLLLCLASAAAFGAMAPFGKLAYDGRRHGRDAAQRALRAGGRLLWALVLATRGGAGAVRSLPARDIALALALGACGYAIQAGCFFAALTRIDASLLSLLVYTFPAIVAVAAIALRRERAERRRLTALALASAGLLLILAGAGAGAVDPLGAALGLAAAVTYATYILVCRTRHARASSRATFAALVCTGAAVPLTLGAALLGDLRPGDVSAAGWGWLAGIAVVCSVASISLFFAGLRASARRPRRSSRRSSRSSPSCSRRSSSASG